AELGLTCEEVIDYYMDIVTIYKENAKVDIIKADKSDNHFIEAAMDSGCNIIITGDEHLLEIKEFKNITILKPKEFLEVYRRIGLYK
ncbi:MAG TPA: putative toxin-antitoxin system toxin component, PIN family, partial [Candidatus Brocadiales bacterium]|nr:putative toxin-antitoxin system toxin component, PIN family [Candidatus Brocadiales bacterium]